MKLLTRIIGYVSIVIGLILISYYLSALIDYLINPGVLRLFMYPYHVLIVQSTIGILLTIAGILLIKGEIGFQRIYLLVGYFYFTIPITEIAGNIIRYGLNNNDIEVYLIVLAFYLGISIPILLFFNCKKLKELYNIERTFKINMIIFLILLILNTIMNITFGNFCGMI